MNLIVGLCTNCVPEGTARPSESKNGFDFGITAPGGNIIAGAVGYLWCSLGGCKNAIFSVFPLLPTWRRSLMTPLIDICG